MNDVVLIVIRWVQILLVRIVSGATRLSFALDHYRWAHPTPRALKREHLEAFGLKPKTILLPHPRHTRAGR